MKKKIKMILTAIIFAAGFFIGFFGGGLALAFLQNIVCNIQENGYYDQDCSGIDRKNCKIIDCLYKED